MAQRQGRVIAVEGAVVDAQFTEGEGLPFIYEVIRVATFDGQEVVLEVVEHHQPNICRCIALNPTQGIRRNSPCVSMGAPVTFPATKGLFGRVFNVLGHPIDGGEMVMSDVNLPIRREISAQERSGACRIRSESRGASPLSICPGLRGAAHFGP